MDECFVYIDNQEDLTGRLSLRGDENVKSNIPISFGKHQIKLDIQIDVENHTRTHLRDAMRWSL